MIPIRRALISVSNKEGLKQFAKGLQHYGVEIISSGGTAATLQANGISVTTVSEYTGSPEILDGRVKTLHPKIFAGILAKDTKEHKTQLSEMSIETIDLVVVNLYPFEKTVANASASTMEIIEKIDIGGPSLVRAAAKNHERVAIVIDPLDYPKVLTEMEDNNGAISLDMRLSFAAKAFAHTAAYDSAISNYFNSPKGNNDSLSSHFPDVLNLSLKMVQPLRYGENPHQAAAFYLTTGAQECDRQPPYEQIQGKALSYNNILDIHSAWSLVCDLPQTSVCIIKHTNPCGAAYILDGDVTEAFRRARATDPVSAFGGIVAANQTLSEELAKELSEMFLEAVVAPAYDQAAFDILRKKKNLRVLRWPNVQNERLQIRSAAGGILIQQIDQSIEDLSKARVVTKRTPTEKELCDLNFAWMVCKHVKSNAIVFAKQGQLVGVGAGQMSRVDSVKLAATKALLPLENTVLASDAFFPFRDGVDEAAKAGATAIVQPGGSIRDSEGICAADEHNMAMVFTGVRHFRH